MKFKLPVVIVVSNGKGGVGKTTYCMHLISSFLFEGFSVFSIDLDCKQKSLTTYLDNRARYKKENPKENILISEHYVLRESKSENIQNIIKEETDQLLEIISSAKKNHDVIIIDTPGDFSHRSACAHLVADIVITPINDSFIDISVLANIDSSLKILNPSVYSNVVWEQKMKRVKSKLSSFEWYVVRNRVNNMDRLNKNKVGNIMQELSKQLGFKIASGFSDRIIFKDLFLHGLTLIDIGRTSSIKSFTSSNLVAKTELRFFLQSIQFHDIVNLKK